MRLAIREARALRHHYLGTEHILLGIMRSGEGVGFELLTRQGISPERVSTEIVRILSQVKAKDEAEEGGSLHARDRHAAIDNAS